MGLGNPEWQVPACDGVLPASATSVEEPGAQIATISPPDRESAQAFATLLLDRAAEGGGEVPFDLRSFGIREFDTICEGLLKSEPSRAKPDLVVDPTSSTYPPVRGQISSPAGARCGVFRCVIRKTTFPRPADTREHLTGGEPCPR